MASERKRIDRSFVLVARVFGIAIAFIAGIVGPGRTPRKVPAAHIFVGEA
jgi:hypothetical protein